MATRHRFQVDGTTHTVVVDETEDGVLVTVDDGEPMLLDATTSGVPGVFSWLREGEPANAYVARDGRALRVVVGGRSFTLAPAGAAGRQRGAVGTHTDPPGVVSAPVAGVVVEIRVAEGDAIELRQTLVVIEAMKMQNEVQAPLAGTIRAIRCQQGARVEKGDVVVEYDPAETE